MSFFKQLKGQVKSFPELKSKFQRALMYAGPQKKQISFILILTLFIAAMGAHEPLLMKFIFDSLAGDDVFRNIALGILLLAGLIIFKETLNGISNFFTWRVRLSIYVALEHIFSILDTQDLLGDEPDAIEVDQVKGGILFDNICFGFNPQTKPILKSVSLHIKPGENVAIVGPSGSGKSTLMALLQRFYDPDEGSIYIDGIDLKKIRQASIRKNIGVVLQEALLFNESIYDNICYGRPSATRKEVYEAAKAANAHLFIEKSENGYETIVGERGNLLSMGERQRIAIARALLKDPPILILDEATSALDAEVETLIQEALDWLTIGRTTFVIAHRLATVVNADKIIVLKEGKVIEAGSHTELMEQNGYYFDLVLKQTKGLITPELVRKAWQEDAACSDF